MTFDRTRKTRGMAESAKNVPDGAPSSIEARRRFDDTDCETEDAGGVGVSNAGGVGAT